MVRKTVTQGQIGDDIFDSTCSSRVQIKNSYVGRTTGYIGELDVE